MIAALLAVALPGCGTDRGPVSVPGLPGTTASTAPPPPGAPPSTRSSPGPQGGGARPAAPPATGRPAPAPPPGDADGARGAPGAYARTLLRPAPANRLVVEHLVEPGVTPGAGTLERLERNLEAVSGKPVDTAGPVALPASGRHLSDDDIRALADRYGQARQGGGQAVVRMLFVRGSFAGNEEALGVAVRGDVAAVFVERVRAAASPLVPARLIEEAVALHELGHLLGLVDLVLRTGRADPEHPGHSPDRDSVMYWAVESDVVTQVLGGPPSREFDAADRSDLAALRAGA